MTFDGNRERAPELTTTRIGGGRRVWAIALGVLVVLGGFVYVGVTGPAAPPPSTPRPSTAVAIASPTTAPTPNLNEVAAIRADPTAPFPYQYLGTGLTLGHSGTLAVLDPLTPSHYRGTYRIPYALAAPTARLELEAVTASISHDDLDRFGSWQLSTQTINDGQCCPTVNILDTSQGPQDVATSNPNFIRIATNGFRLIVTAQNQVDAALMTIDVTINDDPSYPTENYRIRAGPPDSPFTVALEKWAPGGYDGQALIPRALLGTTVPVTLTAVPMSDPALGDVAVGSWSIRVPVKPTNQGLDRIEHNSAPRPISIGEPQLLANGYMLVIGQQVVGLDMNLVVGLSVFSAASTR